MLITNGSKQLVRYINTGPTSDENGQDSTAQLAGGECAGAVFEFRES